MIIKYHKKIAIMGFDEKEVEELGLKNRMPLSLKEALANLKGDDE